MSLLLTIAPASLLLTPRAAPTRVSTPTMAVSRRDALLGLGVAAAAVPLPAFAAPQLKECPKGVQNCYSTASGTIATWTWPKSSTKAQAIKDIEAVLDAYPQAGQAGVDGGGWARAVDELVENGYARFEFKSAGTGNLARFLNGGKPFVDDLEVQVEDTYVRSSTRTYSSTSTRTPPIVVACQPFTARRARTRAGRRALGIARWRLRLWRERQAGQLHRQGAAREGVDGGGRRLKVSS